MDNIRLNTKQSENSIWTSLSVKNNLGEAMGLNEFFKKIDSEYEESKPAKVYSLETKVTADV